MNQLRHLTTETLTAARATEMSYGSVRGTVPRPNSERPHVGLLILFGPETRAFLHSGLAARLAEQYRVSVITAHPGSVAFAQAGPWQVYQAPDRMPSGAVQRLRGWNRRLHAAWMQGQHLEFGPEKHRNGTGTGGTRASRRVAVEGNGTTHPRTVFPIWLRTAAFMERSLAGLTGNGKAWEHLYQRLGLDCLIAADHASPAAAEALSVAVRGNLAAVVLTNSWKDVYVHPFVGASLSAIGVAGQREADHLRRANPQLSAQQVSATGSLHLERFLKSGEIPGRVKFCRQAGLDPSRPFLCYTAAAPSVVRDEELIVETMLALVDRHPRRPQVLLRLNPREDGERFRPLQSRFESLILQKPDWEWDPDNEWNAPLPEDLDTWVATVHHAAFNVSIPSTVTLEFSALGRLTVNICFDANQQAPETSNARFWSAPFYRGIRHSPLVAGAFSPSEFRELLTYRLDAPGTWSLLPRRRGGSPVDGAEALVRYALATCGKRHVRSRRFG